MKRYACPECGSTDLEVVVSTWARLIQTADGFETDASTPDDSSHEWGDNSVMRCVACNEDGIAEQFEVDGDDDQEANS